MDENKVDGGFRVVTNPKDPERDIKVFLPEGEANGNMERLFQDEAGRPDAVTYAVPDYRSLALLLTETDELKAIPDVRFCAAGRGYVKFTKTDGGFPPEESVRRIMASAPALPKPGSASVTIRQDAKHPEGVVVPGDGQDVSGQERWARAVEDETGPGTVDRFVSCYMALGGTFGRLTDHLEGILKRTAARVRARGA